MSIYSPLVKEEDLVHAMATKMSARTDDEEERYL
jgi:hypothetical protein